MPENKMKVLEYYFNEAKEKNLDVALELTVPDSLETEIIIVKNGNLDNKLNYYKQSYNEDLELIRFTKIKIINIKTGHFSNIME